MPSRLLVLSLKTHFSIAKPKQSRNCDSGSQEYFRIYEIIVNNNQPCTILIYLLGIDLNRFQNVLAFLYKSTKNLILGGNLDP